MGLKDLINVDKEDRFINYPKAKQNKILSKFLSR